MTVWVRVRDPISGHEYDLSESDARVRKGLVVVLENYPENRGRTAQARRPKFAVNKAGRPRRRPAKTEDMTNG